jgi:hypothetical protein
MEALYYLMQTDLLVFCFVRKTDRMVETPGYKTVVLCCLTGAVPYHNMVLSELPQCTL